MDIDLTDIVLIDNHAHSLSKRHLEVDEIEFRRAFTEARSMSFLEKHVASSLHYQNMLNRLKAVVDFDSEEGLIERRQSLSSSQYVNLLWDDASIGALLIDDGYMHDEMISVNDLAGVSGRPIYGVFRLEPFFEKLIQAANSFKQLENDLESQLSSKVSSNLVSFKTIAAYRGGLPTVHEVSREAAQSSFLDLKKTTEAKLSIRIEKSPLYHYLLLQSFDIAGQNLVPVQIHCGIGDSDLQLHESNPSLLTPILKSKRFANCRFVLLHCYPYHREAAYLCSVFPNCYMDLSLSVVLLSAIARQIYLETIAQAPPTKILAGTDGHSVPEMHWYGAVVTKSALGAALNQLIDENYMSASAALSVAENILFANSREFYQLEGLI